MANTQFQCPGNDLDDLVRSINETLFFITFRKPDKDRVESLIRKEGEPIFDFEPNLQQEIDGVYSGAMQIYEEQRVAREKLSQYFGINPDEIKEEDLEDTRNKIYGILRRHVENHKECLDRYFRFLDGEATSNEREFAGIGKDYDKEAMLKSLDDMYLGLMNFHE